MVGVSSHYSASHSFTLRASLDDRPGSFADLARAIADAGGLLDAIDLVRVDGSSGSGGDPGPSSIDGVGSS